MPRYLCADKAITIHAINVGQNWKTGNKIICEIDALYAFKVYYYFTIDSQYENGIEYK